MEFAYCLMFIGFFRRKQAIHVCYPSMSLACKWTASVAGVEFLEIAVMESHRTSDGDALAS